MEQNREILHDLLLNDDRLISKYDDFNSFENHYFSDEDGVNKIYNFVNTIKYESGEYQGQIMFRKSLFRFYELYVCDLSWAKNTKYCGGSEGDETNTPNYETQWSKYPCVVELAKSKGVSMYNNGGYRIGDFSYFANGRKGIFSTGNVVDFTCNDPEFKK